MTTRTSRPATSSDATPNSSSPLQAMADLPRRQMAMLSQSASAMYRASTAVVDIQQQAAQRASAQHEAAVERLRGPCDFNEILAVQAELLRFNLQEATQYWQQLTTAAVKAQAEMAGSVGQLYDAGQEPTLDALQRAFEQSINGSTAAATH